MSSTTDTSFKTRVKRYRISSGPTLLVLENRANPTVSLAAGLKAGAYFNPPGEHIVSSLTASMLTKGTRRRTKLTIAEELETMGARRGFSANTFHVTAASQSLSRDFARVLGTIAEELREPAFPREELDKLKQQAVAAIKRDQEDTRSRAIERLSQLLYAPTSPFYDPPAEEQVSDIESLTRDDLERFYNERYSPESMIIAIVGDIESDDVRTLVEDLFGSWSGVDKPSIALPITQLPNEPRREFVEMKDKANADVAIGHPSRLRRKNPDFLAAVIANRALGQSTLSSRLGLKVRDEMGLTYGINSSFVDCGIGDGPFVIGVTVAPANIELAISTSMEIVEEFRETGIREEELRDEKSSWIGSYKVGLATNAGMASQLLSTEIHELGIGYLDDFPMHVASLTKDEVDDAIKYYFHPKSATTVIAGTL